MSRKPILSMLQTWYLSLIVGLLGISLILIGEQFDRQIGIWAKLLCTIGTTFLVVVVVQLLHNYFMLKTFSDEVRSDITNAVRQSLISEIEIISECMDKGIKKIYSNVDAFYMDVLPQHINTVNKHVIAIGIGLTGLTQSIMRGSRSSVIEKLKDGKKFEFYFTMPYSKAAKLRNLELDFIDVADEASLMSHNLLQTLHKESQPGILKLSAVTKIIPKATLINIDDKIVFAIHYFTNTPTACSFVIETHYGDKLYDYFMRDMETIKRHSEDFHKYNYAKRKS